MDKVLNIAAFLGGGMGDMLNLSAMLYGVKRKFPQSTITVFMNRSADVFRDNKCAQVLKLVDPRAWMRVVEQEKGRYDISAVVRYPVKYYFSDEALNIKDVSQFKKEWEHRFKGAYENIWNSFLDDVPTIDKFLVKNNMDIYQLRKDSSNLDYDAENDQFISVKDTDYKASEHLNGLRMVLVNNSGAYGMDMTKSWTIGGWSKVIQHLKNRGIYVVQVGGGKDLILPGVNETFFDKTIHETAALIKRSLFGVFIEGGLVHVSVAVGKRSIVLFGPTPIQTFGYDRNINLKGNICEPCWWALETKRKSKDWNTYCLRSGKAVKDEAPICMLSLDYIQVNKAVDEMLIEHKIITRKGIQNV
jgi:ADP-heptose:LPS heptosyltransferase